MAVDFDLDLTQPQSHATRRYQRYQAEKNWTAEIQRAVISTVPIIGRE